MTNELHKTIIWVTIYSIGMAFIESSVVVYLRALCYSEGFAFPMKDIGNHLTGTEFFREIGTLIMLVSIGFLAGKTRIQRFAYFIFSFAVWDIFYYIFLKILLDWPSSLAEWDILFLVPVPWVGPVIAPVICALLMIFLALALLWAEKRNGSAKIDSYGWIYLITGSLIVIVSFTMDYVSFLHRFYSWGDIIGFQWMSKATKLSVMYIPEQFNWWVFFTGIAVITTGILRLVYMVKR